ncbi:flagellar transcriptional regulator FlhD [Modicisalibacter luteus]|nr:flagellar transcriptional regulator FlhD [Halomonas lutea]
MLTNSLLNDIQDINLSYLLLMQRLINEDRATAMLRLKISEPMADMLALLLVKQLTVPFKTLKTASAIPRFSVWLNRSYPMNSGPLSSRCCHHRNPSRVAAGLPSPTAPP